MNGCGSIMARLRHRKHVREASKEMPNEPIHAVIPMDGGEKWVEEVYVAGHKVKERVLRSRYPRGRKVRTIVHHDPEFDEED